MAKISIIVPIYNVEAYLQKCLSSILDQTYRQFELILVNDGSTDASGEICDYFAASDDRITVIHKKNGGVTSARKAGLRRAIGDFVGWVDPNDWIEKDYFEKMVLAQEDSQADIVAGNHFRDIGKQSYTVCNNILAGLYTRESILPKLIYSGKFFEFGLHTSLCTKLIRRSILDKIQPEVDEEINCDEDTVMVYLGILEAKKVLVTEYCGYHYVQRQGSITKSEGNDDLRRLRLAFRCLEEGIAKRGVWEKLRFPLRQWEKYLLLERQIWVFDEKADDKTILLPYGGLSLHSRIVIYGASALGQTIVRYIGRNHLAENVLWIDKSYENFQRQGLQVYPPEDIQKLGDAFDYVLLASVTESIVNSMHRCLLELHVPEEKIRWLSESFVQEEIPW